MRFTGALYVLRLFFLVISTLFTQLPVVDVRQYKGGAAEIFRFDLLIDPKSDPSVSKVVQQFGVIVQ